MIEDKRMGLLNTILGTFRATPSKQCLSPTKFGRTPFSSTNGWGGRLTLKQGETPLRDREEPRLLLGSMQVKWSICDCNLNTSVAIEKLLSIPNTILDLLNKRHF